VPHRFAVLWETAPDHRARPVGLAVEQDGYVLVEVRDDLCIPRRYDKPFTVGTPDLTTTIYRPGDAQYFDQVLLDLSRAFTIGKQDVVMNATEGVVLRLLREEVLQPLRRGDVGVYAAAGKYPAVRAYRHQYGYTTPQAPAHEHRPAASASEGSLVVA
jgi:hypothetical protein